MAMPVGITSRPPAAAMTPSSRASRSSPASPPCGVRRQRQVGVEADDVGQDQVGRRHDGRPTLPVDGAPASVRRRSTRSPARWRARRCPTRSSSTSPARRSPTAIRRRRPRRAEAFRRTLLTPVINATGVLLHTNLGRAPLARTRRPRTPRPSSSTWRRASGGRASGPSASCSPRLCGAESAMVVNNNAAAVLLVVAALAAGRDVPVSRGESVEIGGAFRVPEVMAQSGARSSTSARPTAPGSPTTRGARRTGVDAAIVLKVHPSNYRVDGFVEDTSVARAGDARAPCRRRHRQRPDRRHCPWLPRRAAGMAGRRAGGRADAWPPAPRW